jgi:hypothetical protein
LLPLKSEGFHPAALGVCDDDPGPGQPCPVKRPAVFKKLEAHSGMLLDPTPWSSDSELESELEEEALAALPLLVLKVKGAFAATLFATVFFVASTSFDNSDESFCKEFPTTNVTLLRTSLVDS